jgi:hypothetical protein
MAMYQVEDDVTDEELAGIDVVVTLAITWHAMKQYERVLRRISRWKDDDGPSKWARDVLKEHETRLQ